MRIYSLIQKFYLLPTWLLLIASVIIFGFGIQMADAIQYIPIIISGIFLGLPHGATDHFVPFELTQKPVSIAPMFWLLVAYIGLLLIYLTFWFIQPELAFLTFVILTMLHWGLGELHSLLNLWQSKHIKSQTQKIYTTFVRGSIPVLVPLLHNTDALEPLLKAILKLFQRTPIYNFEWLLSDQFLHGYFICILLIASSNFILGYFLTESQERAALWIDIFETALLICFFLIAPPVFAIGIYLFIWHSIRHIARLLLIDPKASKVLLSSPAKALLNYSIKSAPTTVLALAIMYVLSLLIPPTPHSLESIVALYIVLISALTLPHMTLVTWMDHKQKLWSFRKIKP